MQSLKRRASLRYYCGISLLVVVLALGVSTLSAQGALSIAQGFKTTEKNIVPGALVGLKSGTPNSVELSTSEKLDHLLGVVGGDVLIELSDGGSTVDVVTSGDTLTLVSDINGAIKAGDKITSSPIAGVGMKATTSTLVIGTAQASLSSVETETRTVTAKDGQQQAVRIGLVSVQVDKVFYEAPDNTSSFLPPALQDLASTIAGRQVSPVRIMAAAFLVMIMFVVISVLLYSAVRSSIISIGRNPLSERAVQKSLLNVGLIILGVTVFTVVVVYLILTT